MLKTVITSIHAFDTRLLQYNLIYEGNQFIWVEDEKSVSQLIDDESLVIFSLDAQNQRYFDLSNKLPRNHYSRKNLGYVKARDLGARFVLDTDDDNYPKDGYEKFPPFQGEFMRKLGSGRYNVYKHFSDCNVWPRGLGYQFAEPAVVSEMAYCEVGVWQGLADGEPDVDAIYRLAGLPPITFRRDCAVVLNEGLWCPFNSQNTLWPAKNLLLCYLPSTVTFRFCDILRSYVAQSILWSIGELTGFVSANVYQVRNHHDLLLDLESEISMYKNIEPVMDALAECAYQGDLSSRLFAAYTCLEKQGIVHRTELEILEAYVEAMSS